MVKKWSKNGLSKIWDHLNTIFAWVFATYREPKVGAAAEGRHAHFWVAAEGRHLYLSKTQAKMVFKWSQILLGPFFDHFLGTFWACHLGMPKTIKIQFFDQFYFGAL